MSKLLSLIDGALLDLAPEADLVIAHDQDLLAAAPSLDGVKVIRLNLPTFKDGRAFSQASLLRQRYGFEGEIRISGHVVPDQAHYLRRTGVDAVELEGTDRVDDFRHALGAYRYGYQRAVNGKVAFEQRSAAQ
ncbi:MAG: DUF934 domain-containing protein [Parvularculaceae bacterium]|nr:DUF934 domain-containing protein [Parvularculaceae bacterium]